jgi:ABC-type sugar transport system substrate-binding protein
VAVVPNQRVLLSCLYENLEYQRAQAEEARSAGLRVGLDVDVVCCEGNPVTQVKQIGGAVLAKDGGRPVAVVLHPVTASGLQGLVRETLRAGVGWISLDPASYLEAARREYPEALVAQVASDNREVGRLQARLFRALLPAGGTVVSIEGPSLSAAVSDRRDGLREGLVGSRVTIVKTLTADWSGDGAERVMSFWLRMSARGARPALVGAQNDLMAAGARKAVLALRPEWQDVLFTGVDGLPEGGQRQVREKALVATVVQPLTAGVGIELVARSLRGEKVPPTQLVPPRTYPSIEELERRFRTS